MDFQPDVLQRSGGRPAPCKLKDSGALNHAAAGEPQQWLPTTQATFKVRWHAPPGSLQRDADLLLRGVSCTAPLLVGGFSQTPAHHMVHTLH